MIAASILLFIALVIGVVFSIALWKGLKMTIDDYSCAQEVKSVKTNLFLIKLIPTILTLIILISLILIQ